MNELRPRLLFLSPLPPPVGGISNWMLSVLDSPLQDRFELRVANTSPSATSSVHARSRLRPSRSLDALCIFLRFCRDLLAFRPQIVHVNTSYFWAFLRDGLGTWIASLLGARTLMHFHGGDFPEFVEATPSPIRVLIHATLRRVDRLIAITEDTRGYLEEIVDPGHVRCLPNFIGLHNMAEPPNRRRRADQSLQVLFVGWIVEGKGVRELLEAARALPDVQFILVGPKELAFFASIRDEAERQRDHLTILSPLPHHEVMQLYRRADIFVLPTHREGFPMVILEAMAAALPVIATPVGAIAEVIRDQQDGLLVPIRDAPALEQALRNLIEDRDRRLAMGESARRRVEASFSQQAVMQQLESIYAELMTA